MRQYFFIIIFVLLLSACSSNNEQKKPVESTQDTPTYELATVQKTGVESTIRLPAQLAAYEEVSIFPKVNGYVKTVSVDIGSKVTKGQLLMVLEAPELQQATLQAKEKYTQTLSVYALSKEEYQRLLEASATAGAISPFNLSSAKAKMDADSIVCIAEKNNWLMQQTMQDYLRITAPFSGVITERSVYPGALVSAVAKDKPMLELKDISRLRLQVDVPEGISLNDKDSITFSTSALPGQMLKAAISRKSMNIESQLRAERIEADINNSNLQLSPGMYADVVLQSNGSAEAYSVPKSAIYTTTEGKYIFVNTGNDMFKKTTVSTGNQTADKIEIFGVLKEGEKVVTNPDDAILDKAQ